MRHPLVQSMLELQQSSDRGKIVSAEACARLIRDGDTVATGGFVGIGFAGEMQSMSWKSCEMAPCGRLALAARRLILQSLAIAELSSRHNVHRQFAY